MEQELIDLIKNNLKVEAILLAQKKYGLSIEDATRKVDELKSINFKKEKTRISSEIKSVLWLFSFFLFAMISIFIYQKLNQKDTNLPYEQVQFETTFTELKNQANFMNKNELSRDEADVAMQDLIKQGKQINGWIAEVVSVEKTLMNGNILRVRSKNSETKGITNYLLKGIDDNDLLNLNASDHIIFSGNIIGSDQTTLEGFLTFILSNDILEVQTTSFEQIK